MGAGRGAGGRAVSRVTATTVIAASVLVLLGLAGARSTAGAATAETLTFAPAADTFVALGFPGTNYGSAAGLEVDNSPVKHLLLKFTVSGIGGRTVQSAKLRLYAFDPSPSGGRFFRTASSSWSESAVTWTSAPAADPSPLAILGAVAAGAWYEVDLSSLVKADGTYSLRVTSTDTNGADYTSKEGTAGFAPRLVVTTAVPPPPPPPPDPTGTYVIAGAGDIANSGFGSERTAALLDAINPHVVFTTGDNAYPNGSASQFTSYYEPTWHAQGEDPPDGG